MPKHGHKLGEWMYSVDECILLVPRRKAPGFYKIVIKNLIDME